MKYCKHCHVYVSGEKDYCPLCENDLPNETVPNEKGVSEEVFPQVQSVLKHYSNVIRMMAFLSIIVAVVSVTANIMMHTKRGWWCLFVVAAIICFWISFVIALRKRKNVSKHILWQMLLISIICVAWDYFTGWRRWSIDYALPVLYIAAVMALVIVNKVLRGRYEDYVAYILMGAMFGIFPLLFIVFKLVYVTFPSLLCVATSIICSSSVFIFHGEALRSELKRRLHL